MTNLPEFSFKIKTSFGDESPEVDCRIEPLGDQALILDFSLFLQNTKDLENKETSKTLLQQVIAGLHHFFCQWRDNKNDKLWFVESVPAYTTLTIFYNPFHASLEREKKRKFEATEKNEKTNEATLACWVSKQVQRCLADFSFSEAVLQPRLITVPVCYERECAPDLETLAKQKGMSTQALIELHCSVEYQVAFVGFVAGFPFLSGLPEALHCERKAEPRLQVPAGSVAIARDQSGIYPRSTPGGWQLIGRSPLVLFDPFANPPSTFQSGDKVRFEAIGHNEFLAMQQESVAPSIETKKSIEAEKAKEVKSTNEGKEA